MLKGLQAEQRRAAASEPRVHAQSCEHIAPIVFTAIHCTGRGSEVAIVSDGHGASGRSRTASAREAMRSGAVGGEESTVTAAAGGQTATTERMATCR